MNNKFGLSHNQYAQHLQQFDNLLSRIEEYELILKNKGEVAVTYSGQEEAHRFQLTAKLIQIFKRAAFTRYDDLVKAGKQYQADTVLRSHGIHTNH